MRTRDPVERLVKFYDGAFGALPNREEFKIALQQVLSVEELKVIFLVPPGKGISLSRLIKKAERAGIHKDDLHTILDRLLPEGFVARYTPPQPRTNWFRTGINALRSRTYTPPKPSRARHQKLFQSDPPRPEPIVVRMDILILTEIQIRKAEDDPMRRASVNWMNTMIEDAGRSVPNKTPYKRVLPIQGSVPPNTSTSIQVQEKIADPRAVLPLDVLEDMIRREEIIAVADCYCRSTKLHVGEGCDHLLRTCFYFDEIALLQISSGRAERIDLQEAMRILHACQEEGLVPMVDNNKDRLGVLCNCCACSCPIIKSHRMGGTNIAATSRFLVSHKAETCTNCGTCLEFCQVEALTIGEHGLEVNETRCIGCGVCVVKCPEESMSMVMREDQPLLARDAASLERKIALEVIWGLIKRRFRRTRVKTKTTIN